MFIKMKCLVFICAVSLVTLATCAPGKEIREKQSATQDVTDKIENFQAARPRRQASDTVDIVYIDAAAIDPSKVNLQNKETTHLQPVNDVNNLQSVYKFPSAPDSKLELVTQNSNFIVYKLKDGDDKTAQASDNQYFQYDNGQNLVEDREPPPPPPPDHHHPPPPPPRHHHHPPPPYGYPPPPHHHHPPPPPPPDDYRSNYYDQYNSYYDDYYNRPPPNENRRIYDDRQTRQSPNDRPYHHGPPPYRGGPPDRFYGRPPHHGGPPDRFDGRPPHHGPPDRFDNRPPHHGGPPDSFDRRPPPHHGGPPDRFDRRPPPHHGRPPPFNDPWSNHPRPPPNDGGQPNDNANENYQNESTTSTTTTTTVAPDDGDDDQYQLDVRFADDDKMPTDETTKIVRNPKRGTVTTQPILSRLFQAAAVTPAD